jgi:sarcosine oxidase subunit gamma
MSAHPRREPGGRPRRRHAPPARAQAAAAASLGIADLSDRPPRLQGPRRHRLAGKPRPAHPAEPNSWLPLDGGGLIARLGFTEFLIEGPDALIAPSPPRPAAPACIRCCARTPP